MAFLGFVCYALLAKLLSNLGRSQLTCVLFCSLSVLCRVRVDWIERHQRILGSDTHLGHLLWSHIFLCCLIIGCVVCCSRKKKCHKFGAREEQILLNLSFVTCIATQIVMHFDGGLELLWQTFPAACYMWSTLCQAVVANLAVHHEAHAWVSRAPPLLDHFLHWGLGGGRLGKNFNDFSHLV